MYYISLKRKYPIKITYLVLLWKTYALIRQTFLCEIHIDTPSRRKPNFVMSMVDLQSHILKGIGIYKIFNKDAMIKSVWSETYFNKSLKYEYDFCY